MSGSGYEVWGVGCRGVDVCAEGSPPRAAREYRDAVGDPDCRQEAVRRAGAQVPELGLQEVGCGVLVAEGGALRVGGGAYFTHPRYR